MIKTGIYYNGKSENSFLSELNNIWELNIVGYYSIGHNYYLNCYKKYHNYDTLLEDVDAIIILSDDFLITDLTKTLKKRKHLYFINPQNINLDEIKFLYKLANESNVVILPDFSQVKYYAIDEIRSLISKPLYIETNFYKHTNTKTNFEKILEDMIFEDLFIVLSFVNSRIKKITTNFSSLSSKNTLCTNIEFYNAAIAKLSFNTINSKENHVIKLYCNDSLINVDINKQKSWIITSKNENINKTLFSENIGNLIIEEFAITEKICFTKELKLFANLILTKAIYNETIELLINIQTVKKEILSKNIHNNVLTIK